MICLFLRGHIGPFLLYCKDMSHGVNIPFYQQTKEAVVASLGTHKDHGLSAESAKELLHRYGENILVREQKESIIDRISPPRSCPTSTLEERVIKCVLKRNKPQSEVETHCLYKKNEFLRLYHLVLTKKLLLGLIPHVGVHYAGLLLKMFRRAAGSGPFWIRRWLRNFRCMPSW